MISRTVAATSWALHARGLSPPAWKILMILAHMVNPRRGDFDVWPRQAQLADACDMPISTLKRNLDELEEKGFLLRSKRFRKSGGISGCTYTLNVKTSFAMPDKSVETYDFEAEDEAGTEDEALAQNELARSPTSELARSPTGGLAIELLNSELLNSEEEPPSPNGEGPPEQKKLFDLEPQEADGRLPLHLHVEQRWIELKREHPGIAGVRVIDDALRKKIETRAAQHARPGETGHAVWDELLDNIAGSVFLTGRAPPGPGRDTPFKLSLGWAVRPDNFREILGGRYNVDRDPALVCARTGRRLGPTDQALRGTISRIRSARERSAGGGSPAGYLPGPGGTDEDRARSG